MDQNFPTDLIDAIHDWLPADVPVEHIAQIDARLSDLDDDELIIALRQCGYDGLVTNNYKMLDVAHEVAAIVATKAVIVATVETGHDPIRAVGALLLQLPGLPNRILPNQSNVFWLRSRRRPAEPGWDYLKKHAQKIGTDAAALWALHRPDINTSVLE